MSFAQAGCLKCDIEKGDSMSQLHLTEIGRVAVPSADQDKALEFYRDTLGFEVRADETFADGQMRWIEVVPPGQSTALALPPPMPGGPTAVDTGVIISTSDIEADYKALKDAGVEVDDEIMRTDPPVPPMFWLRDPNGNRLAIVEPLQ
jgi:catechol 2,3-dioxygenase-like lactoylglutathione lyase family enzyme